MRIIIVRYSGLVFSDVQRVLIAQALAQQAPVLLLDEPTAGVDAPTQQWIEKAMAAEAARGVAVVHITHDHDSV